MNPRAWTAEDDALLTERWRAGDDVPEIAKDLGRSIGAIKFRACKIGLSSQSSYRWAPHEVAHLRDLRALNVSMEAMVAALGRSEKAIRGRLTRLKARQEAERQTLLARRTPIAGTKPDRRRKDGGANPGRARRLCLGGCGQTFMSEHIGNRICPLCAKRGHANAILEPTGREARA